MQTEVQWMYQRSQSATELYNKTQLDVGLSEEAILRWGVRMNRC